MFRILTTCKGGGYRFCRTDPPHPRRNAKGLYPLHIVLMENKLSRLLRPGEEVHHRDENKANDDPENLEVLTKSSHAKLHADNRTPTPIPCTCPQCGSVFDVKPAVLRTRVGRNKQGLVFCSRPCAATYWATHP